MTDENDPDTRLAMNITNLDEQGHGGKVSLSSTSFGRYLYPDNMPEEEIIESIAESQHNRDIAGKDINNRLGALLEAWETEGDDFIQRGKQMRSGDAKLNVKDAIPAQRFRPRKQDKTDFPKHITQPERRLEPKRAFGKSRRNML